MDANEVQEQLQDNLAEAQKSSAVVLAQNTLVHQQWLAMPMTKAVLAALDTLIQQYSNNLFNMSLQTTAPAESVKQQAAMTAALVKMHNIMNDYKLVNQLNEQ